MRRKESAPAAKRTDRKRNDAIYSANFVDEIAVLCGHLRENPLMSNAELRILTGYSDSCIRNCAGKARTIVKNSFKKSA